MQATAIQCDAHSRPLHSGGLISNTTLSTQNAATADEDFLHWSSQCHFCHSDTADKVACRQRIHARADLAKLEGMIPSDPIHETALDNISLTIDTRGLHIPTSSRKLLLFSILPLRDSVLGTRILQFEQTALASLQRKSHARCRVTLLYPKTWRLLSRFSCSYRIFILICCCW